MNNTQRLVGVWMVRSAANPVSARRPAMFEERVA